MADVEILDHPRAAIEIAALPDGRRRVSVRMTDPAEFMLRASCETSYPTELVRYVLGHTGPAYLCDQIARDESWDYVGARLQDAVLGYLAPERFRGARLLDFGCGSGASTMNLSRMLPETEILGVEMDDRALALAGRLVRHHRLDRVSFRRVADPSALPDDLGTFDFVVMNAVYEHLLPGERSTLLAQLWSSLRPGGVLFLNETPDRWFPWELHTSGLPLLNYLPDRLAGWAARRFSPRCRGMDWPTLLRAGIRGGTAREVIAKLAASDPASVVLLEPRRLGFRDRVDLALATPGALKLPPWQRAIVRTTARMVRRVTGITLTPTLTLAIEKRP